ncbi:hypothetical protein GQ472_04215 [archaeon]|nr:hypothetical protein [archaeon]
MKTSASASILWGIYDIYNLDLGWGLSKIGAGVGAYRLASFLYFPENDIYDGLWETTSNDGNSGW